MLSNMINKYSIKPLLAGILVVIAFSSAAEQVVTSFETSAEDGQVTKGAETKIKQKKDKPAKRFVPTEKLRADDAISFPVDI